MRITITLSPTNAREWTFFTSYEVDSFIFRNGAMILNRAVGMGVNRVYGWNPQEPKTILIPLHAIQYAEIEGDPNSRALPDSIMYYGDDRG